MTTIAAGIDQRVRVGNLVRKQLLGLQFQADANGVVARRGNGQFASAVAVSRGEGNVIQRVGTLQLRAERHSTLVHRRRE